MGLEDSSAMRPREPENEIPKMPPTSWEDNEGIKGQSGVVNATRDYY
jgi:hypothetical protein